MNAIEPAPFTFRYGRHSHLTQNPNNHTWEDKHSWAKNNQIFVRHDCVRKSPFFAFSRLQNFTIFLFNSFIEAHLHHSPLCVASRNDAVLRERRENFIILQLISLWCDIANVSCEAWFNLNWEEWKKSSWWSGGRRGNKSFHTT